jgi:phosphatidylinositol alpha-mannosyltransferase
MLVNHIGGEPVVIPNGVYVDQYRDASPRPEWRGEHGTVVFVGRLDEPRKGFPLMAEAFGRVAADRPGLRLLVVGGGDIDRARALLPAGVRDQVEFLGRASDEDKAAALSTADVYVAPNTGGESFGIVLAEAMAAGAPVLASDLDAFRAVLGEPEPAGVLFPAGDAAALAERLAALLDDPARRAALSRAGRARAAAFDWPAVAAAVLRVYRAAIAADPRRIPIGGAR